MNYTHRKPYIPLAPALPRFALPSDGTEEPVDPLDSAATAQRPALTTARARRVVRRRAPAPDSTEEVQVEDILLEAYVEDPPPPPSRQVFVAPVSVTMASASSSIVPPPREQSAAVDELLRASAPEFAAAAPHGQPYPYAPSPYGPSPHGPRSMPSMRVEDHEAQSISPMMLATTTPPPPPAVRAAAAPRSRGNRAVAVAIWSFVIMLVGVAAGAAVVIGVRDGTYARLRDAAASAAARATDRTDSKSAPTAEAAAAAPTPPGPAVPVAVNAPAPVAAPSPAPVAAPAPKRAPIPTVSVDSLSEPPIPAGATLVTFPPRAKGHRIFVDGRPIAVVSGGPTKLRCGRRLIKIGSGRKARATNLACGRAVTLK